jgi:hypothetical protein
MICGSISQMMNKRMCYNQYCLTQSHSFFDEDEFFDDEYDADNKKRKRKGGSGKRGEKEKPRLIEVTGEDGYIYTIKKKIK